MSTEATPSAPSPDISDADLYAAAEAVDAGQPIPESITSPTPAPETTDTPPAAGESAQKPTETADQRAEREEAELAEQAAAAERAEAEKQQQQATKPKPGEKPESAYDKAKKDAERKDRTWKQVQAEKEQVRQEAERLKQQQAEIARIRTEHEELKKRLAAPVAPAKDEHGLEAQDDHRLAKRYEEQGDDAMAKLARGKAAALEAKAPPAAAAPSAPQAEAFTTPEFQAKWRAETAALVQAEPDLARADNPVVQTANALLQDKNWSAFFLSRPDGIRAAVEVAKLQHAAARAATLEKEVATHKAEVARLTKLVSPRGSHPGLAAPADKRPEDLSEAELYALAAQADAAG
jgi:hypothetical protein